MLKSEQSLQTKNTQSFISLSIPQLIASFLYWIALDSASVSGIAHISLDSAETFMLQHTQTMSSHYLNPHWLQTEKTASFFTLTLMVALLCIFLWGVCEQDTALGGERTLTYKQNVGSGGHFTACYLLTLLHESQSVKKRNMLLCKNIKIHIFFNSKGYETVIHSVYLLKPTSPTVQGARFHFNMNDLIQGAAYGDSAAPAYVS